MLQKRQTGFLLFFLTLPPCLWAESCQEWIVKVISQQGKVDTQSAQAPHWHPASEGQYLCYGDKIRTSKRSRATLLLKNETIVTLDQNTTLIFKRAEDEDAPFSWFIDFISGSAFFRSRQSQQLNIQTPFINAVHEGTEFVVTVEGGRAKITVFDGEVTAQNARGKVSVVSGQIATAGAATAPSVTALTVGLEDAVQWSLYYPPLIYPEESVTARFDAVGPIWQAYRQGEIGEALQLYDTHYAGRTEPGLVLLQASLLLTVGRGDEALAAIDGVLSSQPSNGRALALLAVIEVAKNRRDAAERHVQAALTADPQAPVVQIALSYVLQAQFQLTDALAAAQKAVELAPEAALAWVRVAELQFSTGDHDAALASAQRAEQLNPYLSRTAAVLGFAHLMQVDIDAARQAFDQAIALDSADPLPRLGLALSKIRRGDLADGKTDLETAVNLDPNNAVVRSYLGKALHQLDEEDYAAAEFALAKQLDDKDPTPWFYSAIQKQALNRPAEALDDMQEAIARNGNRGVHRSKLMLDEDEAVRTVNLSRIYQDLGFDRVALHQARTAVNTDASSHAAHRFLSDAYTGQPRYRIARASELLQAQLLQPINITPVQPQLTSENIGLLNATGPSRLSNGEYDSLFTSNGAHLYLNGAYGSNNTYTDNAIVSGVYDQLSLSLGQFHYQTDGFRTNDYYNRDIYNAFVQYAFTPDFSVQMEFKTDDIRSGDLPLRLNGVHRDMLDDVTEEDSARAGLHYRIAPGQDLLFSGVYVTRKNSSSQQNTLINPGQLISLTTDIESLNKGFQTETQYVFHGQDLDIMVGIGFLSLGRERVVQNTGTTEITIPLPVPPFSLTSTIPLFSSNTTSTNTEYFNSYLYTHYNLLPELQATLGLSYDDFQDHLLTTQQLNPKLGLLWQPLTDLSIRGAVLRGLKRPLATNQTLEPTQVGGVNQFYDGTDGTSFWQYSIGLDGHFLSDFYIGAELNWASSNVPVDTFSVLSGNTVEHLAKDELVHRAYLYWQLTSSFALTSEYRYDQYNFGFTNVFVNSNIPQKSSIQQFPFSLHYYDESGLFTSWTVTYVDQEVTSFLDPSTIAPGTSQLSSDFEQFWTLDAALGYRLPDKFGVISFEVRNLLNHQFAYDSVFDASGPQISSFVPEREMFLKLSLYF